MPGTTVTAVACGYDHSLRTEGLSDHSALLATIAPAEADPGAEPAPPYRCVQPPVVPL